MVLAEKEELVTSFMLSDEPVGMVATACDDEPFMMAVPGKNLVVVPLRCAFLSACACITKVVHNVIAVKKYLFIPIFLID